MMGDQREEITTSLCIPLHEVVDSSEVTLQSPLS